METTYTSIEELIIWQQGMQICYEIYDELRKCRDFGLKNQMERSAVSIPSNIAEGYELSSDRAFIRHLYIAKGSSGELRTQLYIAIRQKYITENTGTEIIKKTKNLSDMIQNFITTHKKRMLSSLIRSILLFFR